MENIKVAIEAAIHILVIQADNPDGDSLASALAFEHILGDMGKQVTLYCGVAIPDYLKHLEGWDRVSNDIPSDFDLSIIVDTSAFSLLEQLQKSHMFGRFKNMPCLVVDHHADVPCDIPFATEVINAAEAVSTGEVIYELAQKYDWSLNQTAREMIAVSIMSDSLGLVSEGTTARTIHIIAELVDGGVSLATLEDRRRAMMKKSIELTHYKGQLLQRVELAADGRLAMITIPWEEIEKYSHDYNPSMLVLDEMRYVEGVAVAVAFKVYPDGKVTGKIRCNNGVGIAADLAQEFGGGGHAYAAGFKVTDKRSYTDLRQQVIQKSAELLS